MKSNTTKKTLRSMYAKLFPKATANKAQELPNNAVETPNGWIVAVPSHDKEYPGIWIMLRPNGKDREDEELVLALIEYTETEWDYPEGQLITRVYGDGLNEEYTHRVVHTNINEYFKALKYPEE